jgi:2-polyprenyl-3-methyl-5-hydroxy-6-metoxy-1,4-benzoquinol methylase
MNNYSIIVGYKINNEERFLNTENRTDEWQDDVYKFSKDVLLKYNLKRVIDFGCGSAFKLIKYFKNYEIIGYDLESTVTFLKSKYPDYVWVVSDFNSKHEDYCDLLICADVIEHVTNPLDVIDYIIKLNPKHIVISTPNRDDLVKKRGVSNLGPPVNKHHIREWGFNEFNNFISEYFEILSHFKIESECGQVIHCKLK